MKLEFWLVIMFCLQAMGAGRATFSVLVLDAENETPLPGIKIEGSFLNYSRGWNDSAIDNDVDAITNEKGVAQLSGCTEAGVGGYRIYSNVGFYNAEWNEIKFNRRSLLRLGAWQPSHIISTARLDRIIRPIPLYVKEITGAYRKKSLAYYDVHAKDKPFSATNDVPIVRNELLSLDLVKGAWLPPHGDGEYADVQFLFNETVLGWEYGKGYDGAYVSKKYKMKMSVFFPGEGNGLVDVPVNKCAGIQVRRAPLEGYTPRTARWIGWFGLVEGRKTDIDKTRCHAFRIRTHYDEKGKIKSCYYGKIYKDFNMFRVDGVEFLYYLNLNSNDRNLEWGRKNNLCSKPDLNGEPLP